MRPIKFRGKCIETSEWVYGFLVITKGKSYIIEDMETNSDYGEGTDLYAIGWFEVDSKTVGQYTGLTDKNGREIYEGDIVKCTKGCPHEVIWKQEHGGAYFGGMPTWYLSGLSNGYAWTGEEEIIGNIYENPELLEVQT